LQPDGTLEAQIVDTEGVVSVQEGLIGPTRVKRKDGSLFNTVAIALDEHDPYFRLTPRAGAPAFSRADGVWIGTNTQRVLDVDVGDMITLVAFNQEQEVEVLGVVSYVIGSPVFIPRSLLEQWVPGGVFPTNTAFVRVEEGAEDAVRNRLSTLPGLVAIERSDEFKRDMDFYLTFFRFGTLIFGVFGYILTLAVLFNTVNGSLREQHVELSIQRALGAIPREIGMTATLELLVMVVIGLLIGIPIGLKVGFFSIHMYETDFFGTLTHFNAIWYLVGVASLTIIAFIAEVPGLRAVQRVDLGEVSKSQSL